MESRPYHWCFLLVMLGAGGTAGWSSPVPQPTSSQSEAQRIIDHVDRMLRGNSSQATVEMTVATSEWKRAMRMAIWSEGTDNVLIRIEAPKKDEGTATLRTGGNIWNYLPKIDRMIRVPTSMMMAAWMGSHFTNDDLVKESRLIRDYDVKTTFEGPKEGIDVYEFLLTPRPEAPVVWDRIVYQVRKGDLMPVWAKFYGEDAALKRTLTFSDYGVLGGRLVPRLMRMAPHDKAGEFTELRYLALQFNVAVPPRTFSLNALKGS